MTDGLLKNASNLIERAHKAEADARSRGRKHAMVSIRSDKAIELGVFVRAMQNHAAALTSRKSETP